MKPKYFIFIFIFVSVILLMNVDKKNKYSYVNNITNENYYLSDDDIDYINYDVEYSDDIYFYDDEFDDDLE